MSQYWRYSHLKEFFNPATTAVKNPDTNEVEAVPQNFQPVAGKSWADVENSLQNGADHGNLKLIFLTRHGETSHNTAKKVWGKRIFARFSAINAQNCDPDLNPKGHKQAEDAAMAITGADGVPKNLWPQTCFSSSLGRCIVTALIISRRLPSAGHVWVSDHFREWMGWQHKQANDQRSTRSIIRKLPEKEGGGSIHFIEPFPEDDMPFNGGNVQEAYVDVDKRVQTGLDYIFNGKFGKSVHISMNNRTTQSFLRVIGHATPTNVLENNFGVMNMANGATVAFLVKREKDTRTEMVRSEELKKLRDVEVEIITSQKKKTWDEAFTEAKELSKERAEAFEGKDANGNPWMDAPQAKEFRQIREGQLRK